MTSANGQQTGRSEGFVVALSGGVGGAKLAVGLAAAWDPERLVIACNTGDDFDHLSLRICPDLDSVMYALAGVNDTERGWGRAEEEWTFLDQLRQLSPDDAWFQLGDRDLATHVLRTAALRQGESLSTATTKLCAAHGIACGVVPMSDDRIATVVSTSEGELEFQHYFVKRRCEPALRGVRFTGIRNAWPAPSFAAALERADLAQVVICPSNPFVSVDPILAVPGVTQRLTKARERGARVVAVSPIVGGEAIKGPAAKMLRELGMPSTATAVAKHYSERDLIDRFVLDEQDAAERQAIEALGLEVLATDTVMRSREVSARLAREILSW